MPRSIRGNTTQTRHGQLKTGQKGGFYLALAKNVPQNAIHHTPEPKLIQNILL